MVRTWLNEVHRWSEIQTLCWGYAKVTDFDITHHQCWGDPLQYSKRYYQTLFNNCFKNYEDLTHNQAILSAIKADLDNINVEYNLLQSHIISDIEKDLVPNRIFTRKSR